MAFPTYRYLIQFKSGAQQEVVHRPAAGPVIDNLGIQFVGYLKNGKQTDYEFGFRDRPANDPDTSVNIRLTIDLSAVSMIKVRTE